MMTPARRKLCIRVGLVAIGLIWLFWGSSEPAPARGLPPPIPEVPEIDAGSLGNAATLLIGGMMIAGDRIRRKR